MGCCKKCGSGMALVLIIVGVLFLLQDRGAWHFWGLSWYTVAFLLLGLKMWGCSSCKDCCKSGSCEVPVKKARKRKK